MKKIFLSVLVTILSYSNCALAATTAEAPTMNKICELFEQYSLIGITNLYPHAYYLIVVLTIIDVGCCYMWFFKTDSLIETVVKKLTRYFFVAMIVGSYTYIIGICNQSLLVAGVTAAGMSTTASVFAPSTVLDIGLANAAKLWAALSWDCGLTRMLALIVSSGITVFAYWLVAIAIMLVRIEFAVFCTFGLILIPFYEIKIVGDYATRIFSGVIIYSFKMMVTVFMLGVGSNIINSFAANPDGTATDQLGLAMTVLALAFLLKNVPDALVGMLNGQTSNNSAMVAGVVTGVVGGLTRAGMQYGMMKRAVGGSSGAGGLASAANMASGEQSGAINYAASTMNNAAKAATQIAKPHDVFEEVAKHNKEMMKGLSSWKK